MYKRIFRHIRPAVAGAFLLAVLPFVSTGCIVPAIGASFVTYGNRSVAHKPELMGGYQIGERYAILRDVFIMPHYGLPRGWALELPEETYHSLGGGVANQTGPESVEAYKADPTKWPEVKGVVAAGARLQIVDIRKSGDLLWGQSLHIRAKILDGFFTNQIVDICDLSKFDGTYKKNILMTPDSRILERQSQAAMPS